MGVSAAKRWMSSAAIGRLKDAFKTGNHVSGNYEDWQTAKSHSSGYDSERILESVRAATSKVISGAAAYERDSILFDTVQHSFPVLVGLLRAALEYRSHLSVLDFGGSLGSSFYQCRDFLRVVENILWGVVEQEAFVHCGQRNFQTKHLRFFNGIEDCVQKIAPNCALLSSVLQYVENPYAVVESLVNQGIPYIIIDRTVFSQSTEDRIAVQYVPKRIYDASYPIRIFGRSALLSTFAGRYTMLADFDADWDGSHVEFCDGLEFISRGMIFRANVTMP